jgi:site-specific recombinase XerD
VVLRYRFNLEERGLAPGTINVRMAAVRRLAFEAADSGLLSPELAAGIYRVKGVRKLGSRLGNWLTAGEASALWQAPDAQTLTGKRNRAILAILLGCGLRRRELAELKLESLQRREERWAIVDLVGKGRHIRTVPVPAWVKYTLDEWLVAAGIEKGPLFRCVCRADTLWGDGISEKTVWHVVKKTAATMKIAKLSPHDLRRSCARLCHDSGGELEQIQFLLGHVSVQTTERYIGCKQRFKVAVTIGSVSRLGEFRRISLWKRCRLTIQVKSWPLLPSCKWNLNIAESSRDLIPHCQNQGRRACFHGNRLFRAQRLCRYMGTLLRRHLAAEPNE